MTEPPARAPRRRRAFWLKQVYAWHWMSAALSLLGILLFTVTGITLNHAADIEAAPKVMERTARLPAPLLADLATVMGTGPAASAQAAGSGGPRSGNGTRRVPPLLARWLETELGIAAAGRPAELSSGEVRIDLPRPGGDAWVSIDLATGEVLHERTDRGWVSYLNDLHKGRNTGTEWRWFIDVFAVACLVFCITGLVLLQLHAGARRSTWPLVALGLVLPVVLAAVFIHG